jgi:hypothetical protein
MNLSWRSPKNKSSIYNAAMEGGATVRIQTHLFEMFEVIFFVADPMVHKPLLPTNNLFCAAMEGGATISPKMTKNSCASAYP